MCRYVCRRCFIQDMCAQANSSFKPNRCSAAHGYIRGAEANSYWQPAQGGSSTSAASQYPTLELVGGLLATAWNSSIIDDLIGGVVGLPRTWCVFGKTVNAVAPFPRLCASVYACRAVVDDWDVGAVLHGRPRHDSWPPGERKLAWTPVCGV